MSGKKSSDNIFFWGNFFCSKSSETYAKKIWPLLRGEGLSAYRWLGITQYTGKKLINTELPSSFNETWSARSLFLEWKYLENAARRCKEMLRCFPYMRCSNLCMYNYVYIHIYICIHNYMYNIHCPVGLKTVIFITRAVSFRHMWWLGTAIIYLIYI